MDHRVPRVGMAISIILAFGALVTFLFLNKKFEGPDPVGFLSNPYELKAEIENSKTLPSKQPVLYKGVSVGRVRSVDYDNERKVAVITFTLDDQVAPIHEDAVLQVGERSLLGDAYLNLMSVGTESAPELESQDTLPGLLPDSVDFDEALDFLDEEGRGRVRSLIDTFAEGLAPRDENGDIDTELEGKTRARLNGTLGGVNRTAAQLVELTETLKGQEQEIGKLVSDSAVVLDELGNRESSIREIVASGRATMDALAANTTSLGQAVEELPLLLASGQETLANADPLLREARPLVEQLGDIAPRLTPAFREGAPFAIGPVTDDLVSIISGLPAQRRVSEKVLPRVVELNKQLGPIAILSGPAATNTATIAEYIAPRANSFGAFYALGRSATNNSDSVGRYTRFGTVLDPGVGLDAPIDGECDPVTGAPTNPLAVGQGFCYNAYPAPNDSLKNLPFSGEYPRLLPFEPPPKSKFR